MRYLRRLPALLLCCAAIAATGAPKLPPPPQSRVGLMGDEMVFNGIPMDVQMFETPLTVPEVIEFYGHHWPTGTEKQPGYVVSEAFKPWTLITRAEDGYLMTVQVTSTGAGSRGFLARSRLDGALEAETVGDGFPVMHGTSPMNDVRTRDGGKDGRTLAFVNDRTPESNAEYYRTWFMSRGWTQDMDKSPGEKGHVLSFRSGNKSVNIVINGRDEDGRTYIVAQTTNFDEQPW